MLILDNVRKFDGETDKKTAVILNETAVNKIGWENPLGKKFKLHGYSEVNDEIIGIIKDFYFYPLKLNIEPLALKILPRNYGYLSLKINPERTDETIDYIENLWKEYSPDFPFNYQFLEERINRLYITEYKLARIINYFVEAGK